MERTCVCLVSFISCNQCSLTDFPTDWPTSRSRPHIRTVTTARGQSACRSGRAAWNDRCASIVVVAHWSAVDLAGRPGRRHAGKGSGLTGGPVHVAAWQLEIKPGWLPGLSDSYTCAKSRDLFKMPLISYCSRSCRRRFTVLYFKSWEYSRIYGHFQQHLYCACTEMVIYELPV